jgi:sortase A
MGKFKIIIILGIVGIFIGLGIFLYPFVKSYQNEQSQQSIIYDVQAAVDRIDDETIEEMWTQARNYNDSLSGLSAIVESDSEVLAPTEDTYNDCLNFANGTMGYLEIPSIDLSLPIYHGTTDEILSKGVGHLYGSSLPIGGEGTHSVLTSHSGMADAVLFTRLPEVEMGDVFYIHVLDAVLAYRVDDIQVVLPNEVDSLVPEEGKDYVTLVTCYPVTVNTHRLLVRGVRAPDLETDTATETDTTSVSAPTRTVVTSSTGDRDLVREREVNTQIIVFVTCIAIFLVIAAAVVFFSNRKKKKKRKSRRDSP